MTWAPVTMRWPAEATAWMEQMGAAKGLAGSQMADTGTRLQKLAAVATTNPGPVGGASQGAISAGRAALAGQFGDVPACIVVTPFQAGIGQGSGGHQRFLSAPNLLQLLANKLTDSTDVARPQGQLYGLVVLFLSTRQDHFAATLQRFNTLLPMPDLVRAERRSRHLSKLEVEKWELPAAGQMPRWGQLPLQRCPITKVASQAMSGQLAMLESYAADSSPMADLASLQARKQAQSAASDQKLVDLQAMLANSSPDTSMQARLIGPGDGATIRRRLLEGDAPGHEWPLCAGALLVGSLESLGFVRELVGL